MPFAVLHVSNNTSPGVANMTNTVILGAVSVINLAYSRTLNSINATQPVKANICSTVKPSSANLKDAEDSASSNDISAAVISPWLEEFTPATFGFSLPTVRNRAYTCLLNSNANLLIALAHDVNVRQNGVKNQVICRLMLRGEHMEAERKSP